MLAVFKIQTAKEVCVFKISSTSLQILYQVYTQSHWG